MDLSLKWIRKYFLITARVILWQFVILSKTTNLPVNTFCRAHWVKCTYFEWMKHTAKRLRFDRYLCDDSLFSGHSTQRVFFITATFSDKFSFLTLKELRRSYPSKFWAKIFIAKWSGRNRFCFTLNVNDLIQKRFQITQLQNSTPVILLVIWWLIAIVLNLNICFHIFYLMCPTKQSAIQGMEKLWRNLHTKKMLNFS